VRGGGINNNSNIQDKEEMLILVLSKYQELRHICHKKPHRIELSDVVMVTLRSLTMAVIVEPSAPLFIASSHCVVITRAGASARVRSATNMISGFRTVTLISILDAGAGATTRRRRGGGVKRRKSDQTRRSHHHMKTKFGALGFR